MDFADRRKLPYLVHGKRKILEELEIMSGTLKQGSAPPILASSKMLRARKTLAGRTFNLDMDTDIAVRYHSFISG